MRVRPLLRSYSILPQETAETLVEPAVDNAPVGILIKSHKQYSCTVF